MVADSESRDPLDFELPEGLDDDLGGDWESAFQAEDFMLSPDEEPEDFFVKEEGSSDDDMDLASLLGDEDTQPKQTQESSAAKASEITDIEAGKPFRPLLFLPRLAAFFTHFTLWFNKRPFYQKIALPALPLLVVIILSAGLFFRSTDEEPLEKTGTPEEQLAQPLAQQKSPTDQADVAADAQLSPAPPLFPPAKLRKKWSLPAFIISVPRETNQDSLLIRVDITLVLKLDPGQPIPENKRIFIRDAIYQFYTNRPADELQRYPLARGEMIRKLSSWLDKQWPQNPIANIIFNRYQVIK